MKTRKFIPALTFVTLCFTTSAFADEASKQPELVKEETTILSQKIVGAEVEKMMAELKQELAINVSSQVKAALSTVVATVKNTF